MRLFAFRERSTVDDRWGTEAPSVTTRSQRYPTPLLTSRSKQLGQAPMMSLLDVLFSAFGAVIVLVVVFSARVFDQPQPQALFLEAVAWLDRQCTFPNGTQPIISLCVSREGKRAGQGLSCVGRAYSPDVYLQEEGFTYLLWSLGDEQESEKPQVDVDAWVLDWNPNPDACTVDVRLRVRTVDEASYSEFTLKPGPIPEYQFGTWNGAKVIP